MQVLIVDDHPIIRSGLRRLLAADPGVEVSEAGDGEEALRVFRRRQPQLVILDLNLPGIGGTELIVRLKVYDPKVRILVLSMHDDQLHVNRALKAGAAGYLSKSAPPDEILTAVRRVAAGQTYVEHRVAEELAFSHLHMRSHPLGALSSRDLEILRLLATGRTLPQIAETVGISYKTAANCCSHLKARLGAAGTADLIRIAIRSGLLDRDADLKAPDGGSSG